MLELVRVVVGRLGAIPELESSKAGMLRDAEVGDILMSSFFEI